MSDETDLLEQSETRGPKFPSIGLEKALELAQTLYDKEKRAAVAVPVILSHWGYKNAKSSSATMAIAALRSYGLIDYQGTGPNRSAKLSTRGLKILLKTPDRESELREAALSPKIHKQIWDKFSEDGLPTDEALKHYLILDLGFNDTAVDGFLARLRNTFSLAKLSGGGTISEKPKEADGPRSPAVGDWVQWTSQGSAQFPKPRQVTKVDERDGEKFLCVQGDDGQEGWIPMNQATLESPVAPAGAMPFKPPMINKADDLPGAEESRWKLPSGHAVLKYPANMTENDFVILQRQIALLQFAVTGTEPDSKR